MEHVAKQQFSEHYNVYQTEEDIQVLRQFLQKVYFSFFETRSVFMKEPFNVQVTHKEANVLSHLFFIEDSNPENINP